MLFRSAAPDVLTAVRSGAAEVERIERRLGELEGLGASGVGSPEYASLRERFEALGGYHLDQRVAETLAGLGVPRADWSRPPLRLSGGEQTRVALARLIVADPDLLILDEPTNHLDLATKEMLLDSLSTFEGTMLFVSHDRSFLRGLSNRVLELGGESGTDAQPHLYPGSYVEYVARTGHEAPGVHA